MVYRLSGGKKNRQAQHLSMWQTWGIKNPTNFKLVKMLKPLSFSSCKTLIECKNGLSSDKDNTLAQHLSM